MGCPNKSSKEFKALVKDTGLSESYVYSIVHKFQNSSKLNENEFPSKEYILNTLEGNNTATSKIQIDYWLENNSTPKEFEVGRDAKKYSESLEKFYNKEAIVIYRKGNGKYVVKVAAPKGKYQVLKIISGALTGVDTIGLQVAKELGISTKGKAPKGFLREKGYDEVDVREFGVEEITDEELADYTSRTGKKDPYTARTELNVRNSDGTVYFYTSADSLGMKATKRSAMEWNKPFLINPTSEVLAQWIKDNNIKVLNVAGNRGTKLENPEEVSNTLKSALKLLEEPKSTTPSNYTEEEQSILDKAPRNSKGLLLAPNGLVSNLTVKLYVLVRTKAFKKWFGDWERKFSNVSYKDIMLDYFKSNPAYEQELDAIEANLGSDARYIAESAYQLVVEQDNTNEDFGFLADNVETMTALAKKAFGENAVKTIYYASDDNKDVQFDINQTDYDEAMMDFINLKNKYPELDLKFNQYEVLSDEYKERVNDALEGMHDTGIFQGLYGFVSYVKSYLNNHSKVVDENGEPKVMYHGTNKKFDTFDKKVLGETTGSGTYTDKTTGEEVEIDSNNAFFFSDSKGVGVSYALLANAVKAQRLCYKVESLISTNYNGNYGFSKLVFKDFDDLVSTLDALNLHDLRFEKIKNLLINNKKQGKKLTKELGESFRELLIETRKLLLDNFNDFDSHATADWYNNYNIAKNILHRYNNKEGIERLKNGEIPTELILNEFISKKRGFDLGSILFSDNGNFNHSVYLHYSSEKGLYISESYLNSSEWFFKDKTTEEILNKLNDLLKELNHSIKIFNNRQTTKSFFNGALLYEVFLNVRNPLEHDYEGSMQMNPYKNSKKYSTGYIESRQVKKALSQGNDGVIYNNLQDPYMANNVGIFDSSQVKSATNNSGLYNSENKDIYDTIYSEKENQTVGENISSKGSEFAKKLTNVGNNISVQYKGKTFRNAEHAYQTWKSGEFDEDAYNSSNHWKPKGSKPVNKSTNFLTMVEIITAKLEQHPELVKGINERGGLKYLQNSTHNVIGDSYWESSGENKFIEALTEAYMNVSNDNSLSNNNDTSEEFDVEENVLTENQVNTVKASSEFLQQIDDLYSSTLISASEIRDFAEQIVFWISDYISQLQSQEGLLVEKYGKQFEGLNPMLMSRIELVKAIGPQNILDECKAEFTRAKQGITNIKDKRELNLLLKNWSALTKLASYSFTEIEKFSITYSEGKAEVTEEINDDVDNFNEDNSSAAVAEETGDTQEHWQVESRTLDVMDNMTTKVRMAIQECYLLDSNNQIIKSKFGINRRVKPKDAVNSILRWTQGALDLPSMIAKLKKKAALPGNNWVNQIIDRLENTEGTTEIDFQNNFFSVFCKDAQVYNVVIKKDGKYISKVVNELPALREAMSTVTTQFNIGEHPMFISDEINEDSFETFQTIIDDLVNQNKEKKYEGLDIDEVSDKLSKLSSLLGYYATPDMIKTAASNRESYFKMIKAAVYIKEILKRNLGKKNYEPFTYGNEENIYGNTKDFLQPITDQLEDIAVSSTYDSGKMYQTYVTPSYMTRLMQKFKLEGKEFEDFIQDEYGKYPWFKDSKSASNIEKGWRRLWIKELVLNEDAKKIFKHKVQLNFNKHNYMKNMTDNEYTLSLVAEYFAERAKNKKDTRVPAWFRIPMMSNKPSSEFIRFYSERGSNYKDILLDGFSEIAYQEMGRIQTVRQRNYDKSDPEFIKNFDSNGKKFMFMDFLNDYLSGNLSDSKLGKLLNRKLEGTEEKALNPEEEAELSNLIKEAIRTKMEEKVSSILTKWQDDGILKEAKSVENVGKTDEEVRANLENFVWNDTFAAMNIMELTITDMAFYANAEDLQKRLAQIHAPGIRGNKYARDYAHPDRRVSDGFARTFYLTDFDGVKSNIIDNVSIVFDRKINKARAEGNKELEEQYKLLKESIVKQFKEDINVADAQAYNSPTSYRKKAIIFGKWDNHSEEIYQKLRKGEYTFSDLKTAFQPLKPFVYTQIEKSSNIPSSEATMDKLKVPVQNKNSEYLLIMADALLQGEDTGRPNMLRAIYEVMEESHYDSNGNYRLDGIDTVQFESTVKSGLMGRIDINQYLDNPEGEAEAKELMKKSVYSEDGKYNETFIHAIPYDDYCIQQEVPEHFKEHYQAHGSQIRFIIPSDLETKDDYGNPVTYNVEGRELTAEQFKREYEETIAENINEDIDNLSKELHLDNKSSLKERNIALSKILQREILSSPRYGVDLLIACSVDEEGNFRIPLGDPVQSKRVEQLINSIIKNRVNKQEIAGGPVVQVTNYGTSRRLSIRYKNKNNKDELLLSLREFEDLHKGESDIDKKYKDYIEENQGGVAYFEVFAPMPSNEVYKKFANEDGSIDIDAINAISPELLKMIGYRIPTEDKYSIAPLKIVGFLPREAGDGIMLPYEITLLTGSDFDVDKEYLMRKDIPIHTKSRKEIENLMLKYIENNEEEEWKHLSRKELRNNLGMFLDDPQELRYTTDLDRQFWKLYKKVAYKVAPPTEGRTYRDNKIVDMTWEVMTHETTADKLFNPGGFEPQKRMGYMVEVYRNPNNTKSWEELKSMKTKDLKELCNSDKNLSFIDTHIQFYKQNNAAGSLIGMFAVHKVAHAVLESNGYTVDVNSVCNTKNSFSIAGMTFGENLENASPNYVPKYMEIDKKYDINGQLIGKVLGSLVASAADAVKDPVLNLMNINGSTANILTTLIRLGMPFDDAALFLSQSTISEVINKFNSENISGYKSLSSVINDMIEELQRKYNIDNSSSLYYEDLSKEELIAGIKSNVSPEIIFKVLIAFKRIQRLSEALRGPSYATRFNSISNAVGPLVIDNLIIEHKLTQFSDHIRNRNGESISILDIFKEHPILGAFYKTVNMARTLFGKMPANSRGFRNILEALPENISNIIYSDRKLLGQLSDFYQSYLLIASGTVNYKNLSNYINGFPKWFIGSKFKEKYPNNQFIQAITLNTETKTGKAVLEINTTGMKTPEKEALSAGWIDLHKVNPDLSTKLFMYNFFRGGIAFNPKTFMGLVPTYVKERLNGYVDTYRKLPQIIPSFVVDQFIRNNWDNNKLVPTKKVKLAKRESGDKKYFQPLYDKDIEALQGVEFFKRNENNSYVMYKLIDAQNMLYAPIKPLGNNKEYLEISTNNIENPLEESKISVEDTSEDTQIEDKSNQEINNDAPLDDKQSEHELVVNTDLLYSIIQQSPRYNTKELSKSYVENYKMKTETDQRKLENAVKKFLRNQMTKMNLKFTEENIDNIYKLMC